VKLSGQDLAGGRPGAKVVNSKGSGIILPLPSLSPSIYFPYSPFPSNPARVRCPWERCELPVSVWGREPQPKLNLVNFK